MIREVAQHVVGERVRQAVRPGDLLDPPEFIRVKRNRPSPFLSRQTHLFEKAKHIERRRYRWLDLEDISPHLKKAVLAAEDQRFLSHRGFDFTELGQALRDFLRAEKTRGASTISMQTARTVFLWPDRSWLRKIAEAYYTILMELMWSKERIFEIYLNTVHWGKGIMGAEAASRKYFHTSAASLNAAQAALLAAILPNPTRWRPVNPTDYIRERQWEIMRQMAHMPLI